MPLVSDLADGDGEATIDLKFGLMSNNMAGLEKALQDISTPGNPKYRKFLSNEEVGQRRYQLRIPAYDAFLRSIPSSHPAKPRKMPFRSGLSTMA